jgi:hypothetical protein
LPTVRHPDRFDPVNMPSGSKFFGTAPGEAASMSTAIAAAHTEVERGFHMRSLAVSWPPNVRSGGSIPAARCGRIPVV